jgi:hypothetical protein
MPDRQADPGVWHALNLRSSPFGTPRAADARDAGFVDFVDFVDREEESATLLDVIRRQEGSHQVIQGRIGVGRGTLAEYVKHRGDAEGYLTAPGSVRIAPRQSADELLVAVLRHVYEALLARAPALYSENRVVERVRGVVQHQRRKEVGAATRGLRDGEEDPRTTSVRRARVPVAEAVPELMERLLEVARDRLSGCGEGVIVHLAGMEELRNFELRASLRAVRAMKTLTVPGYHFLLVAAPDILRSFRRREPWAARLFDGGVSLSALGGNEVEEFLERRYELLRNDPGLPVRRPLSPGTARALTPLFGGDLRALLSALERLAIVQRTAGPSGDPVETLIPLFRAEAEALLTEAELACLDRLATMEGRLFRQSQLEELWGLRQSRVSDVVLRIARCGYLLEEDYEGRIILYTLTGPARLALGGR